MVKIASRKKKSNGLGDSKNIVLAIISLALFLVGTLCYAVYELHTHISPSTAGDGSTTTTTGTTTASNVSSNNLRVSSPSSKYGLLDDLVTKQKPGGVLHRNGGDSLWDLLLKEAVMIRSENNGGDVNIMEVGMHSPKQCLMAAEAGLQSYCVEPSPNSLGRIMKGFDAAADSTKKNIRFYQMAAGSSTGIDLEFSSSGGTGDHVGGAIDIWHMEKLADAQQPAHESKVTVKSVAIDDIIADNIVEPTNDYAGRGKNNRIDNMFLVKVDTQGFEPAVFSGLTKSIAEHKIDFLITEYWPKGIDFMNDMTDKCVKPVAMLEMLASNGYTLFAMANVSHPSSSVPKEAKHWLNDSRINNIPYHDLKAHCMFYYDVERRFPSEEYSMGYWTDILAVSPTARLPKVPVSELGQLVKPHLQSQ